MTDMLGGKPVSWDRPENWEDRAKRIAGMLKQRQEAIRLVGICGDYALGDVFGGSVLTMVVFLHDWRPDYTIGHLQAMEEMPVVLDWVTDAYLMEKEPALADDRRAHRLATLQPLLTLDKVIRDVLVQFRDEYFGAEERDRRTDRLIQYSLKRLDHYEASGHAIDAVEAFLWGYGPALCHAVDEPPSSRRLLQRFGGAARVRRVRPLVETTVEEFGLGSRDAAEVLAQTEALAALAESYVRQSRADVVGGLSPLWASDLAKAGRAVEALTESGEGESAVFAAMASAANIDASTEHAVPGFRDYAGYVEIADALFGKPDASALRHVAYETRGALRR